MTRQEALKDLNLPETASGEDIENAYRRLVRRYPPEFNPERFQRIDEAYRFLTSLSDMIARLLSPEAGSGVSGVELQFSAALPTEAVEEALTSITRASRLASIWPSGQQAPKK
jgi:curved DNA-binding protein CbpA